jgi:hypothetical protein
MLNFLKDHTISKLEEHLPLEEESKNSQLQDLNDLKMKALIFNGFL